MKPATLVKQGTAGAAPRPPDCAILPLNRWETGMAKRRVMFTFPEEHLREPIIYTLGHQFQVTTNIRRANISGDKGWMVLELEGDLEEIERGIAWVTARGVRVEPMTGDVTEG